MRRSRRLEVGDKQEMRAPQMHMRQAHLDHRLNNSGPYCQVFHLVLKIVNQHYRKLRIS